MLSYKLMGTGFSGVPLGAFQDSATGLAATGTNQGTAYAVSTSKAFFSTVASGTGAVLSANAIGGDSQMIHNGGANALTVYPPSGAKINQLAANIGVLLPLNTSCEFHCVSPTQWTAILSR